MDVDPSSPAGNPYAAPQSPVHHPGDPVVSRDSAKARCPHCGTLTNHPLVNVLRERTGCRSIVLFIVTGIIFYLLWAAQLPRAFSCASCGKLFRARTPGGKLALGALISLVAVLAAFIFRPAGR
ncbi:MAG TPA: hypothetical protein VHM91_21025 [Verrucomicrobiales bacterium]|jgi:ribosomal protein S27E|nr:hypothetical protein [Verrucomicrobiales bacterium]